jgi:hypothetical protein
LQSSAVEMDEKEKKKRSGHRLEVNENGILMTEN